MDWDVDDTELFDPHAFVDSYSDYYSSSSDPNNADSNNPYSQLYKQLFSDRVISHDEKNPSQIHSQSFSQYHQSIEKLAVLTSLVVQSALSNLNKSLLISLIVWLLMLL